MYNLRYHIASLVAVFLALAMGLLLGTIVVDRGVLDAQRTALVKDLQKDFDEIRAESAQVKSDNETLSSFASDALPALVGSTLSTRTVVVVTSPENGDTASLVTRQLKDAGATVAVATFSDVDFSLAEERVVTAVGKALAMPAGSVTTSMVVTALANEWGIAGTARPVTKALVDANALKITGLSDTVGVSGTVVACSFDGKPDGAAMLLALSLNGGQRRSVGVESSKRADGTASAAKLAGISGVDHVDTPMGEVSMIWVLTGRASGLYGTSDGAEGIYPSPLFGNK